MQSDGITQPEARVQVLREQIKQQAGMFKQTERDLILLRVLERTDFRPASKQTVVAAELNLSFGTYRRYLSQAIERLSTELWLNEQQQVIAVNSEPRTMRTRSR